jgi:O-6-methylguanine DNA methyltransferase
MILNKAKFSTAIGFLSCLWTGAENDPGVACISTDHIFFNEYLKKITTAGNKTDNKVRSKTDRNISLNDKKSPLIEEKIKAYLGGMVRDTGLTPLFLSGSVFEKKVWNAARSIPYGNTLSYGDIAGICGNPNAGRAVGNALGKNPVIIIVPCHRVIKSDGCFGGFSAGPDLKKKLLELEGISKSYQ